MSNINKKDASIYEVESHNKGEFYTVDITAKTCSCPHYQFRLKRFGGECKHIVAVREYIAANSEVKEYKSKYKSKKSANNSKNRVNSEKKDKKSKKTKTINNYTNNNINKDSTKDITLDILKEVESAGELDVVKLLEKYGEILVDDLISKGYLVENKGKVKLLK